MEMRKTRWYVSDLLNAFSLRIDMKGHNSWTRDWTRGDIKRSDETLIDSNLDLCTNLIYYNILMISSYTCKYNVGF